ncbi:Alpha/Beta hydrolase protein [Mycena alexandri]|uniref:feruloyl esterase n=1 Tax=Mycena alexandri TaxID=1745969 RepID=A0AAD6SSW4_9AGAR|nr:Alpha/Beta hydrolase protein [Mycena alexandri]
MILKHANRLIFLVPSLLLLGSLAAVTSAGCGSNTSWIFDADGHSTQTLSTRTFLVHVPAKYEWNTTRPHPVVLSFHGYGENDEVQERISGFSKEGNLIDGRGIIAVYPLAEYGPGKNERPARAWIGAPYSPQDVDDIGFVEAILDALQTNLCVDSNRTYVSGMSNGGGFVNLLACSPEVASKFAAFAIVSGALYNGTLPFNGCDPGRKIPLINFHGTADTIIPYDGRNITNTSDDTPPIPRWREAWVVRNGCDASTPSNISRPYEGVIETIWQCNNDTETTVKAFEIEHGIHKWPSMTETTFDATPDQILPFFNPYSLNSTV